MVDFNSLNKMCDWEREKALFLIRTAQDLNMKTDGYGELGVNENTGYTYLWLEDYSFTLYMPIDCELKKSDVVALWTNSEDGEEIEKELTDDTTLEELLNWCEELEKNIVRE